MESLLEKNKAIVRRFNQEVIEQCSRESFEELIRDDFINHTAAPGMNGGKDGMWNTFKYLLQTGFPDLKVIIYDQVAEEASQAFQHVSIDELVEIPRRLALSGS